jgi:hypothetical protein
MQRSIHEQRADHMAKKTKRKPTKTESARERARRRGQDELCAAYYPMKYAAERALKLEKLLQAETTTKTDEQDWEVLHELQNEALDKMRAFVALEQKHKLWFQIDPSTGIECAWHVTPERSRS